MREPSTDSMICGVGGGLVSSLGLALALALAQALALTLALALALAHTLALALTLALVTWSRVTRVPLPSLRNQVKRSL